MNLIRTKTEELLEENSYIDLIYIIHYILNGVKSNGFKDEKDDIINNKYDHMKQLITQKKKRLDFDINDLWKNVKYNNDFDFFIPISYFRLHYDIIV